MGMVIPTTLSIWERSGNLLGFQQLSHLWEGVLRGKAVAGTGGSRDSLEQRNIPGLDFPGLSFIPLNSEQCTGNWIFKNPPCGQKTQGFSQLWGFLQVLREAGGAGQHSQL